jgi:hypothetical protein
VRAISRGPIDASSYSRKVIGARLVLAVALAGAFLSRVDLPASAAEPRPRVLIVIDQSDDPFAERVRAEVAALGFEVVAIEPQRTGESVVSLDAAGRAHHAEAAIRMVASRKGVELWVAHQPTGRSLLRWLIVDESASAPNQGLVALQTAELLRTTLLSRSDARVPPGHAAEAPLPREGALGREAPLPREAVPSPAVPSPEAAPSPEAVPSPEAAPSPEIASRASAARPAPSGAIQAALGVLSSPGGGSAALQVWLTGSHVLMGPLGIALDLSGPVRAGTISGPEGKATASGWLAGASLELASAVGHRLFGKAAVGAAVVRFIADGSPHAPLVGSSPSTTTAAYYARVDGGVEVAWRLRVGVRAVVGTVPSGIAVRFAGYDTATWGRLLLAGMMLVDVAWP